MMPGQCQWKENSWSVMVPHLYLPQEQGMKGAIEKAKEIAAETAGSWIPMQFENEANIQGPQKSNCYRDTERFSKGLDYIITGVGTGGHISGVAEVLRTYAQNQSFCSRTFIITCDKWWFSSPHPIQGIGRDLSPDPEYRNT
ncbi:MAG: pyridoxal-phosphate dependent enzyme [Saprospiraceae bacterium]|nr:pyridoxal-phosphate dependent enzyme [Saprospiraceae bacterium]